MDKKLRTEIKHDQYGYPYYDRIYLCEKCKTEYSCHGRHICGASSSVDDKLHAEELPGLSLDEFKARLWRYHLEINKYGEIVPTQTGEFVSALIALRGA